MRVVTNCDSYIFSETDSGSNPERTAKERIADLKSARFLIEYLIRDAALYSVKYKTSGSTAKKPSEAWVFDESYLEIEEVVNADVKLTH